MFENKPSAKTILIIVIFLSAGIALSTIYCSLFLKQTPPVAIQPTPKLTVTPTLQPTIMPISTPGTSVADWQKNNYYLRGTFDKDPNVILSFKYPKDWRTDEGVLGIFIYSSDDHIGYELGTVPKGKFMIQISPVIEDKSNEEIKSWCMNNLHEYDSPDKEILSERYIEVDGNSSYLVDYKPHNFDSLRQVCVAKPGLKIIIYGEPLDPNYLATFDKILSTFKFIK